MFYFMLSIGNNLLLCSHSIKKYILSRMKKIGIFITLLLSLTFVSFLLAKQQSVAMSYPTYWQQVDSLQTHGMPKSANEIVQKIKQKALSEHAHEEIIRCLIYDLKTNVEIDHDSFFDQVAEIERYASSSKDVISQSVLYAMLAQVYDSYFNANSYIIQQRTPIWDIVPENKKEWASNHFLYRIFHYASLSIQHEAALQKTLVTNYPTILVQATDSYLRPTVYDVLAHNYIQLYVQNKHQIERLVTQEKSTEMSLITPYDHFIAEADTTTSLWQVVPRVKNVYQKLLTFHKASGNTDALVKTDIDRIETLIALSIPSEKVSESYQLTLNSIIEKFQKSPIVVHAIVLKANYLLSENKRKEAYDLCKLYINRFPDYSRIAVLHNIVEQIKQPQLATSSQSVVYPDSSLNLKLNFSNIDSLTIRLYKIRSNSLEYQIVKNYYGITRQAIDRELVNTIHVTLPVSELFLSKDTSIHIKTKDLGLYEYEIVSPTNAFDSIKNTFYVTRLLMVHKTINKTIEGWVVDRITGKPIKNATVTVHQVRYQRNNVDVKKVASTNTNKNGLATFSLQHNNAYYLSVSQGEDTSTPIGNVYVYGKQKENTPPDMQQHIALFTDRALYRPAQSVYVKGIAWNVKEDSVILEKNKKIHIRLRDANYQIIAEKQVQTSSYGSFNTDFILPKSGLTGSFTLETENGSSSFLVEEYKKPTFKAEIKRIDKEVLFNNPVRINGNAETYMGFPLQTAHGKYRIVRQQFSWRRYFPIHTTENVAEGVFKTNDKGEFTFDFIPIKPDTDQSAYYHYLVYVDITDKAGETQQVSSSFSIGESAIYIQTNIPAIIQKEKITPIAVNVTNVNGEMLHQSGKIAIYALKESSNNDTPVDSLQLSKCVYEGSFVSGIPFSLNIVSSLPSGRYKLISSTKTQSLTEVENIHFFTLFSVKDKKPPFKTSNWMYALSDTCSVGEMASTIIGSSANVLVMYELVGEDGLICRQFITLNNESKHIQFPYTKNCGNSVEMRFTSVVNNTLYQQSNRIVKRQPSKKLSIQYITFRDKLQPGNEEEWQIHVKDANGVNQQAEVLVCMYDASLDAIVPHQWQFNPFVSHQWYVPSWNATPSFSRSNYATGIVPFKDEKGFELPKINLFDFQYPGYYRYAMPYMAVGGNMLRKSLEVIDDAMDEVVEDKVLSTETTASASSQLSQKMPIRKEFAETAFFYPAIKTDNEGLATVRFTVPESLTTWKIMTLVHNADAYYGQQTSYVYTQKAISVKPNLPRFVQQSDSIVLTATIYNMLDSLTKTTAKWEIRDAQTDSILLSNEEKVTLNPHQSVVIKLPLFVPTNSSLWVVKVMVANDSYSDGEQHYLPILSSKKLVTESMPFTMYKEGEYTFEFDKLKNNTSTTLSHKRYTIELSPNVAWYALQALPVVAEPEYDNAISLMSSYYANILGEFVVANTPLFKQYIQLYANKEESPLVKNKELKNLLNSESPWIQDALQETEGLSKLQLYLDANQLHHKQQELWKKLQELQAPTGGFSWFAGMPENEMVTLFIAEKIAKLVSIQALDSTIFGTEMMQQAVAYIDYQIIKSYNTYIKHSTSKPFVVDAYTLQALYVRSLFSTIPKSEELNKSIIYFNAVLKQNWTAYSLYGKSQVARILFRNNEKKLAQSIVTSLLEFATENKDKGIFWANNTAGYSWYQMPIVTHVAIMEAIAEIKPNKEIEDKLKIWLLTNKQTNAWNNPIATVDAIYALVFTGNSMSVVQPSSMIVKVNNNVLFESGEESSIGYRKHTFYNSEISPSLSKLTVNKKGNNVSWGAIYWQYEEEVSKITKPSMHALNIDKKMFVEQQRGLKTILVPIENKQLQVGDKVIVRLTISTDRDMDFVHIKDLRASGLEPVEQVSTYRYREGIGYYQNPKDTHTNFFFSQFPKGTYVIEYPLWVRFNGVYSGGISTIQCLYAPEFQSHSLVQQLFVK